MAIALDNSEVFGGTFPSGGTAVNLGAFTVGSGSNRALFVAIRWVPGGAFTVSGVTYNGDALTSLGASIDSGMQLWELANPDTSSGDLIIDPSTGLGDRDFIAHAYAFTGVEQSDISDGYITSTGSDSSNPITSVLDNIVSATGDLAFVAHTWRSALADLTTSSATGYTEIEESFDNDDPTGTNIGMNSGTQTGAADIDTSVVWNDGAIGSYGAFAVNINAAAEAGGAVFNPRRLRMGIG